MRLKALAEKQLARILKITAYYYPVIIFIVFFVLKSHAFNYLVGFSLAFWKTRTITSFGLALLLSIPTIFLRKRGVLIYSIAISLVASLLFASFYIYHNYAGGILSFSAIGYADQLISVTDIIVKLIDLATIMFFTDFFILTVLFFVKKSKSKESFFNKKVKKIITALIICVIIWIIKIN